MKSSTGVTTILLTRSLMPAQMPSGRPISSASSTAATTRAKVSIVSAHSPWQTMNSRPTRVSTATRTLPMAYATKVSRTTVPEPADVRDPQADVGAREQSR